MSSARFTVISGSLFIGTILAKEFFSHGCNRDQRFEPRLMTMFNEASFIGFFPNRKPRTRRAPDFDHFPIGPPIGTNPFQQIENQNIDRVRHAGIESALPGGFKAFLRWGP